MLPAVRKEKIKKMLLVDKSVSVLALADIFSVTDETIRRDLRDLEADGIAQRTHGGAVLREKVSSSVGSKDLRDIMVESKQHMSGLVQPYLQSGQCIFMDSSTTVLRVASDIRHLQLNLTVVTNSLDILYELGDKPDIRLICLGGVYSARRRCFLGTAAYEAIKNYYFDMVLFSCRSVTLADGAGDSDVEEAEIKRVAISRSKKAILLADHTKLGKNSFIKLCDVADVDSFITDQKPGQEWADYFRAHDIDYRY